MTTMPAPRQLPPWRDAASIVAAAAEALRPPRKVLVSQAAERHRRFKAAGVGYSGPWRNERAPMLVEPMDSILLRSVSTIVLLGPSQFGKTEMLLNIIGHAVKYRPADVLLLNPDRNAAVDFSARRIDRMLSSSPDIGGELGTTRSDDKQLEKTFRNGMMVSLIWPTAANLSSKPVPLVLITERDRLADDVEGEGDPVELAKRRTTTFGKEGKVVIESTPSRDDGTGIIGDFNAGDRRLWHVPCLQCGEYFTPGFDLDRKPTLVHFDLAGAEDPEEARAKARIVCPACGFPHEGRHRAEMNARHIWLPEGQTIDAQGAIHGRDPANRTRSYWFPGLMNTEKTLGDIAADLVAAERHFDETGDEGKLRAVYNTVLGFPYKARADVLSAPEASVLKERCQASGYRLGTVPAGVRFLIASVDVQGNRFEVLVKGWDEQAQSWLIDRFAVRQLDDGRTDIRPGECPEHWDILVQRVLRARYPLADNPELTLPVKTTVIDTGGVEGVTEAAKAFWRECRRAGIAEQALTMVKGANTTSAPPLARPTYELLPNGKPNLFGFRHFMVGVSAIKDVLVNRLARSEPGPGAINLPVDMDDRHLDEIGAERKLKGRWVKAQRANETWDLLVYQVAGYTRLQPHRVNWTKPPEALQPQRADVPPPAPVPMVRRRGVRGGVRI